MKMRGIIDLGIRIFLFGLLVFAVVWIIMFFKRDKENIIPDGAVSMDFPLKNGFYLINQSGPSRDLLGDSVHEIATEKYALDIVKDGMSIKDIISTFVTHNFNNNSTFGTPIYSPCFGNIKKAAGDQPDMPIGTRDRVSGGNHVLVGCDQFNVNFAHLKQGSIVVHEGQTVKTGDLLGQIGNSGNSTGPHLHMAAYRTDRDDNIIPLPMIFGGRYLNKGETFKN